jgi:hypothetical protein
MDDKGGAVDEWPLVKRPGHQNEIPGVDGYGEPNIDFCLGATAPS